MKKRMMKRAAAAAMTGAMVMSMTAFPVFAEEKVEASASQPTLTKHITTDGNTYAPNAKFVFVVEPMTENSTIDDNGESKFVTAGVEGGLVGTEIQFTADDGLGIDDGSGTGSTIDKDSHLTVDLDAFDTAGPGVYGYIVKEQDFTYEGITKDTTEYNAYVTIVREGEELKVSGVRFTKNGGAKAEDLSFTNDYGRDFDTTHDVTITKTVEGNQGDRTKKQFKFDVKVLATDNNQGEKYKVIVTEAAGATPQEYTVTAGDDAQEYGIKHSGSIQILGLSATDEYVVEEHNYFDGAEGDGYTTTVDGENGRTAQGTAKEDRTQHQVVNRKEATTPTGIVTTFAPYVLMLGAAGAAGGMFLRKKKEDF